MGRGFVQPGGLDLLEDREAASKSPASPVARACWVRSTADCLGVVAASAALRKRSAVAAGSAKSQVVEDALLEVARAR